MMENVLKLGSWHTEEGEVGASEDVSRAPAIAKYTSSKHIPCCPFKI